MDSIEEVIRLREEAVHKLLQQKAEVGAKLDTLRARLDRISDQLRRLGHQTASGRTASRARKMYDYVEGTGFILLESGDVIGTGSTPDEALRAVGEWCEKMGKRYYPTQWRRVIDPSYGRRRA